MADLISDRRAKSEDVLGADTRGNVEITKDFLRIGDRRYLVGSERTSNGEIDGQVDFCAVVGSILRCRGWAFDKQHNRVPSRFLVFLHDKCVGSVGTIGERYDVAKAMASGVAIRSGFSFQAELKISLDLSVHPEIQVVAVFEESWTFFRSKRCGEAIAFTKRHLSKAVPRGMRSSRPARIVETGQNWRTKVAWLTVARAPHYAQSLGAVRARRLQAR